MLTSSQSPQNELDTLLAQEERLQFEHFDFDVAWALGCFMVELARSRSLGVAIAIRRNGQRLFHAALPGATADNDEWIERKSRVVDRFAHSSRYMGALMESPENNAAGVTFEQNFRLDPLRFAAHGGAFPVIVRGSGMIGTVTVSGLPQLEDHAFIVEALGRFLSDL